MTRDRLLESIADIIGDKIGQRRDIAFDAAAEIVDLPEIAALFTPVRTSADAGTSAQPATSSMGMRGGVRAGEARQ